MEAEEYDKMDQKMIPAKKPEFTKRRNDENDEKDHPADFDYFCDSKHTLSPFLENRMADVGAGSRRHADDNRGGDRGGSCCVICLEKDPESKINEWDLEIKLMKKIMFGNSLMLLGIAMMILAGLELIYVGMMWASFLLIPAGFMMAVIGFFGKDS
jgi:hypothetical protein